MVSFTVLNVSKSASEVTVAEMVDAYTVFPNHGIRTEAIYVTHIEDNLGNVIAQFTPATEEVSLIAVPPRNAN